MAVDRTRWEIPLYPIPRWLCPMCQQGHYEQVWLKALETAESVRQHRDPDWEPDWDRKRFTALLRCDNNVCSEIAVACGTTSTTYVYEEVDEELGERECAVDAYTPIAIQPAPLPFPLGPEVPTPIAEQIKKAAELYWMDCEAAANKLRQATEALLTDQRVKRTVINKNNQRVELSLHSRILEYEKKSPDLAKILLAVKWIGNAGSHVGSIKQKDVLDGFDMMEHALDEIYRKTRRKLTALAKAINRNKGPAKKKKR